MAIMVSARLIGYPRIGPRRELKWALERAWSGRMERDAFAGRVAELREEHLAEQRADVGSARPVQPREAQQTPWRARGERRGGRRSHRALELGPRAGGGQPRLPAAARRALPRPRHGRR